MKTQLKWVEIDLKSKKNSFYALPGKTPRLCLKDFEDRFVKKLVINDKYKV